MALHRPKPGRERILTYGGPGAGKSHALGTIARRAQTSGSDAQFYIVYTDAAWPDMIEDEFSDLENTLIFAATGWESLKRNTEIVLNKAGEGDWIVLDLAVNAWQWARDYYIDKVFGTDLSELLLEQRAEIEQARKKGVEKKKVPHRDKRGGLRGREDWGTINQMHTDWIAGPLLESSAHVYATGVAKNLEDDAAAGLKSVYGTVGAWPGGQKELGHLFRSILFFKKRGKGDRAEWRMTTVKDRGRPQLDDDPIKDFSLTYLMRVAGWRVK